MKFLISKYCVSENKQVYRSNGVYRDWKKMERKRASKNFFNLSLCFPKAKATQKALLVALHSCFGSFCLFSSKLIAKNNWVFHIRTTIKALQTVLRLPEKKIPPPKLTAPVKMKCKKRLKKKKKKEVALPILLMLVSWN